VHSGDIASVLELALYQATGKAELQSSLADPSVRVLGWSTVSRNVWVLGLTSLLTDVSSEMVTSIFPIYVVVHLQLSPAAFGVVDGLQQGGASIFRLASGVVTDRWRHHREVAGLGYLTSALSKLGLLLVGRNAAGIMAMTVADRLGKGIRTSPRDALISLSAPRAGLAAAFGVHRALDTAGAMLGPIVAFALLLWIPGGYDVVFVVSFALALMGLGVLVTFVRNPPAARPATSAAASPREWTLVADPRVRLLTLGAGALGLATLSDSFIYLVLQRRLNFAQAYIPLLFVATPAVYMLLAAPAGRLADRAGRGPVLLAGHAALLGAYAVALLAPGGVLTLGLCVGFLGAYYAATDGVMPALASTVVPPAVRATGLSIVGTANDTGKVLASIAFGWLWSRVGMEQAVTVMGVTLVVVLLLVGAAFGRMRKSLTHE
jgi:MFS family permease